MAKKLVAMVSEVLLSVPCVETMAAAGATKVARRKRGSQQKILESELQLSSTYLVFREGEKYTTELT